MRLLLSLLRGVAVSCFGDHMSTWFSVLTHYHRLQEPQANMGTPCLRLQI